VPNISVVISIITVGITIGGVFIAIGTLKGKILHGAETDEAQNEELKKLSSKEELAAAIKRSDEQLHAAIKRSDEMLALMTKRAEEDRMKGQGQYREFYGILTGHAERISAIETQQNVLVKSLDEIKCDLKDGFKDLQNELKEMRKQK